MVPRPALRHGDDVDRYKAALAGWTLGGMTAPVVAAVVLLVAVDLMCTGTAECSWGLEVVLVLPILLVCFFVAGPRLVVRFSARAMDSVVHPRAARITRIGAAAALVVFYLLGSFGLAAVLLALLIATFGVPAFVVWRTR